MSSNLISFYDLTNIFNYFKQQKEISKIDVCSLSENLSLDKYLFKVSGVDSKLVFFKKNNLNLGNHNKKDTDNLDNYIDSLLEIKTLDGLFYIYDSNILDTQQMEERLDNCSILFSDKSIGDLINKTLSSCDYKKIGEVVRQIGLGILFFISDERRFDTEKFIDVLTVFGCHESIGKNIACDLFEHKERYTTVRYLILDRWKEMEDRMKLLGVGIEHTYPRPKNYNSTKPLNSSEAKMAVDRLIMQFSNK